MAYTISVVNSDTIVIDTGETDNSTSLTLIGKNVPNYGEIINQNFVDLMQHFAGSSEPNGPVEGQLWYDTSVSGLKYYNGGEFKKMTAVHTGATAPNPAYTSSGDLWWDTSVPAEPLLKIWTGSAWAGIGPQYVATNSAIISDSIIDTNNFSHQVLRAVINNSNVFIISKDTFVPKNTVTGFPSINSGINLATNTLIPNNLLIGNISSRTANVLTLAANTVTAFSLAALNIGNSAATLTGTLATNAQPHINSVGTLSTLAVTGNINSGANVNAIVVNAATGIYTTVSTNNLNATNLSGTITTNNQPHINSLGTLASLLVSGSIQANSFTGVAVNASTIGNTGAAIQGATGAFTGALTGNNFTGIAVYAGTIGNTGAAIQGTTGSFTGTVTANTVTAGTIGNSGAILTGTLSTASQPNITAVGTLVTLIVSGNASAGNISTSGNLNVTGYIRENNAQVLHANNFNSYVPTLTGNGASGFWGINATSANTALAGSTLSKTTAKAWVCFDGTTGSSGSATIYSSYNVSSVTNVSRYKKRIALTVPLADTNYAVVAMGNRNHINEDFSSNFLRTTSQFQLDIDDDDQFVSVIVFGN